jgi:alpha-glucosidase (family GH31 glycosyl hydrolase)
METEQKSRKRCIIIVLVVCLLAAAITALILVLVFKGGSGSVPNGINGFTVQDQQDGKWFFEAFIQRTNEINSPVEINPENNTEFKDLRMRVSMMNDHTFRIKLNPVKYFSTDNELGSFMEDIPRWEVPDDLMGNVKDDYGMRLIWANLQVSENPAGVELSDPLTGQQILSTKGRNLIFSDKYIELGFLVDSRHIFGFGERQNAFELTPGEYSSWANGRDNHVDEGSLGGHSYGDHPFVLARLNDNSFMGIFFKNSNAKTLQYSHTGNKKSVLNFRAIGGVLDFFTFYGATAEEVIKAYHGVVGIPYLPPFWSLGFQQSSWQYTKSSNITDVVSKYKEAGMPLEAMWLDIEYMDQYRNFLVDPKNWGDILKISQKMHSDDQKLIAIVDAGFAVADDYQYWKEGSSHEVFIKSAHENEFGNFLIGDVWPGKSAFVDWLHEFSNEFWVNGLNGLHKLTEFDGIWIDMNEATTFCNGECPPEESNSLALHKDRFANLPFNATGDIPLLNYSLSLDGQHVGTTEDEKAQNIEYNMHSLFGTMEARATYKWWDQNDRRQFVLSRSTFAGAGKWTSHWLGDNWSTWQFMQLSIAGIMDFNMFGIPLVGADVCGFHSPFEHEMCGRWMQLSTFYPFARNHYNLTDRGEPLPHQEPYLLEAPWNETAKQAIIQRYSYLRMMYTRLYEINQNGGTLIRPLFFEFPDDNGCYQGYEHSFMVGSALKVSPVIIPEKEHKGKIQSYFPANSKFISLNDFVTIEEGGNKGVNQSLDASKDFTNVHLREGHIIPFQNMTSQDYEMTTKGLIDNRGIQLLIFADKHKHAEGTLFIDEDGDDKVDIQTNHFQYYKFRYNNQTITIEQQAGEEAKGDLTKGNQVLDRITILDSEDFASVKNPKACVFDKDFTPKPAKAQYDADLKSVVITAEEGETLYFREIMSVQYGSADNDTTFCDVSYTVKSVSKIYNENTNAATKVKVAIESKNNPDLPDLTVEFSLIDDEILRVQMYDNLEEEYQAPAETFDPEIFKGTPSIDLTSVLNLPEKDEEFYYEVHEFNDAAKVYYSTKGQSLVYSKYYKRHSSMIDSSGIIFGLGERVGDFLLDEGIYTMWNRDEPSPIENGKRPGNNIYGTHPVYFTQTSAKDAFYAVFDHNVGAQDFIIRKATGGQYEITHIKTSGIQDQFIIMQTSMERAVQNFQRIVGKPVMVPEWGLGWHHCRYGYNTTEQVDEVVNGFVRNGIPLDVMWTDIDYMEQYRDFTVSGTDFANISLAVERWWGEHNIRYIPILDAAVAYEPKNGDSSYARGNKKGVFIRDPNDSKKPFIGKVWPGPAVYLDWLKPETEDYWVDEMDRLHNQLPFSGMWIDMNEASNFCNGFCSEKDRVEDTIQRRLFYTPGARDLDVKSISIDATHEGGVTEFEAHSTYGFYMSKATSKWFTEKDKSRPFVITRSTYSGVGKYVSHWLGDNFSAWDYLKFSIGGIFNFQMFGVPVAGADICGFIGDTTPELCAKWYAIGAFYPFSRNHNDKNSVPQEPFVPMFKDKLIAGQAHETYTDFIREMAIKRYALHRYHYSWAHKASTEGIAYFTPLFYRYPEDPEAYKRVEENIMIGDAVKVSAALTDATNTFNFYFPEKGALWCPIWPKYTTNCYKGQSREVVKVAEDESFVHIKSGTIIPLQLGDLSSAGGKNIEALKNTPIDLAIHPNSKYSAKGWARYDGGDTMNMDAYTEFTFNATGANPFLGKAYLDIDIQAQKDDSIIKNDWNQRLRSVVIYNAKVLSLGKNSKIEIKTRSGTVYKMLTVYESNNNICRFVAQFDNKGIELRDIEHMKISA